MLLGAGLPLRPEAAFGQSALLSAGADDVREVLVQLCQLFHRSLAGQLQLRHTGVLIL